MAYTQENRGIAIHTPLGPDRLLLTGLRGEEHVCRPFRFDVDMLSEDPGIGPGDLVGKKVSIRINDIDGRVRWIHGMVSAFAAGWLTHGGLRQYQATVVPWFWFLSQHVDCRIFQQRTVIDIAETIFGEFGFAGDYDLSHIKDAHPEWEYCTQYQESTFHFLTRLFEHEGIFWYFRHAQDRHVLCLADQNQGFTNGELREIEVDPAGGRLGSVTDWYHRYRFHPGRFATSDYNYLEPGTPLLSTRNLVAPVPLMNEFERYEWPGDYFDAADGDALVRYRMEEAEADWHRVEGASTCPSFAAGTRVALKGHPNPKEDGKEYAFLSVRHHAEERSYLTRDAEPSTYRNTFEVFPLVSAVTGGPISYRPARVTRTPQITGFQTAIVTAPPDHDPKVAFEDEHARVKILFHWDRHGRKDETSSCWLRVSSPWAGKNYGDVKLPLPGSEVIVAFQEGDPDRPVILGCLYNGENRTPTWERDSSENTSTNTIDQGGNAIRTESKEGQEQISLSSPQAGSQMKLGNMSGAPAVPELPLNFPGTPGGAVGGSTSGSSSSTQATARQEPARRRRGLGEFLSGYASDQAGADRDGGSTQQEMTTGVTPEDYESYDSTKDAEGTQEQVEDAGVFFWAAGPNIDYNEYKLTYVNGDSISVVIGDSYKYIKGNELSFQLGGKYTEIYGGSVSVFWGAKTTADMSVATSLTMGISQRVTCAAQFIAEGPYKLTNVAGTEMKVIGGPGAAIMAGIAIATVGVASAANAGVAAAAAGATVILAAAGAGSAEMKLYPTGSVLEAGLMKAVAVLAEKKATAEEIQAHGFISSLRVAAKDAALAVTKATGSHSKLEGSAIHAHTAKMETAASALKSRAADLGFNGLTGMF